jgi:bifunctional DNase/RNase
MDIDTTPETVDMRVIDVRRQPDEGGEPFRHVVVLEEVGGSRRLYIWVGKPEAQAIALQIEGADTPRPLTFRFAAGIIDALGARLREIRITRLAEEVFYAVAVLDGPAGEASVDARPSDAISLALAKGAPIRVASEVVNALQPETAPPVRDAEELEAEGIARAPQIVAEMQALWRR